MVMLVSRAATLASAVVLAVSVLAGCTSAPAAQPEGPLPPHVTTRELAEMRQLSGLTVSPDGRFATIRVEQGSLADNAVSLEWRIIDLASGQVRRIASAGEPRLDMNGGTVLETPQWSPDSEWIYYRAIADQQSQVWRARADGSLAQQVTHDPADVMAFKVSASNTLHYMAMGATRAEVIAAEAAEFDNGVLLDRTIPKGFRLLQSFPINGRMAALRENLPYAMGTRSTLLADRPVRTLTLDLASGKTKPADAEIVDDLLGAYKATAGLQFPLPYERQVKAQPRDRVAHVDMASDPSAPDAPPAAVLSWSEAGLSITCQHAACARADSIAIVGWLPETPELVFQTRTGGMISLNVWDTSADTMRTLAAGTAVYGAYTSGVMGGCQIAGEQLVCIKAGPDLPPRIVSVDAADGRETILFNPNPNLSPERLGIASVFTVADSLGNTTVVRAILPRRMANAERLPLVLTNYTCLGFLQGGSGRDVPEHVLAGMGFAAACVDFGTEVRRKPTIHTTQASSDRSAREFFEAAARKLVEDGVADRDRIALTGFSGGGSAAVQALTTSTVFATAIVTTEPAASANGCYLVAYLGRCQRNSANEGFAAPYDSRNGILADSAPWNAERIVAPLLMQLSESEYESTFQLWAALTDTGRAVETVIFPEAHHYKLRPRQRLAVYDRNIAWLEFWLLGNEQAVRDERARARWSTMRGKHCEALTKSGVESAAMPYFCRSNRIQ